ncbi:MAG TPA: glycosyltransferase family 1 protein [Saprospiraceae bacterium]|nr:glycosyltransferase family 1 protein [Saprospiraceae bacterium]
MNENYQPIPKSEKSIVKKEFTQGCDYFIFVGSLHPRKNLVGLFQGFDKYKETSESDSKLVIVGNKQYWTKEIKNTYMEMAHKSEVIFLGHLDPKTLNKLVSSSLAMMYISYFEGFGIPIIEAFKAETAVITSNVTSMPEVAGDSALLVDPFSISEIAGAMRKIEEDKTYRLELIEKGKQRVGLFSWDYTAEAIWKSIEKVIKEIKEN